MLTEVMRVCALMHRQEPTNGLVLDVTNMLSMAIAECTTVNEIYEAYRQLGGALEFIEFQRGAREYQIMVTGETEEEFESFYATVFAIEQLATSMTDADAEMLL